MMFVLIFSALAVSIVSLSGTNVQIAQNQHRVNSAFASAESGLEIIRHYLSNLTISGAVTPQNRLQTVATTLQNNLTAAGATNITANYDAATATIDVPSVVLDSQSAQNFSATLSYAGDFDTVQVDISGSSQQFSRRIKANFNFASSGGGAFAFGLATRGPLRLSGNAKVRGLNDPNEANVYIESTDTHEALDMSGNSQIEGDVSIRNPDAYVSMSGNATIGGESGTDAIDNHVSIGAAVVELPTPVPLVFEPYATNVVDSSTSTNGNKTFENIRVVAGTNPTFSGNIIINGVIYIESPNHVVFAGNTTITGVVVAEGDLDSPDSSDRIDFSGNLFSYDVSQLPEGSSFDGLRDKTDTFILAPGFKLSFSGNFHTINGAIAGSGVTFSGNAGGTVTNGVINYSDSEMALSGNADLQFDRSAGETSPAGFISNQTLEFQQDSYLEVPL